MGVPKHTLVHQRSGESLLDSQIRRMAPHFAQVLLLNGEWMIPEKEGCRLLPDPVEYQGEGPLSGLLAALRTADTPWVALLAIDQPLVPPELYQRALSGRDPGVKMVVPRDEQGQPQWSCGLFHISLRGELESDLQRGVRALKQFCRPLEKAHLGAPPGSFLNLNTAAEARQHGWDIPEGLEGAEPRGV